MTYRDLLAVCDLELATAKRLAMCEPFICENEDLNDFFANDAVLYSKHLLGKTYLLCLKENPKVIVAAFTLSNDSIRMTNKLNEESKNDFLKYANLENKRLRRFPAVLIGRLATNKAFAGKGIGTAVMDFVKFRLRYTSKTGCRFIIVDAYNSDATLHYYQKNDCINLVKERRADTRCATCERGTV